MAKAAPVTYNMAQRVCPFFVSFLPFVFRCSWLFLDFSKSFCGGHGSRNQPGSGEPNDAEASPELGAWFRSGTSTSHAI